MAYNATPLALEKEAGRPRSSPGVFPPPSDVPQVICC